MHTAEITFKLKHGSDHHKAESALWSLIVALLDDGNIVDRTDRLALVRGGYKLLAGLPERDSLDSRWLSARARAAERALAKADVEWGAIRVIGEEPGSHAVCGCRKPSALVMMLMDLPVSCADCEGVVPLYRLSHAGKRGDFRHVRYWERRYEILDDLWTQSGVGEQFAYQQLSRHDSDLSKLGRELCRKIEKSTKTPTYYYLYRWYGRSVASERKRLCPNCGKKWLVDEPGFHGLEFRCNRCRLISNIGQDARK